MKTAAGTIELAAWIRREPNNRRVPYQSIPDLAPELELQGHGKKAIRTALKSQGFARRVSKRKGFSNQDVHREQRLRFALRAREWDRERLNSQIFSDEVWAYWGANTRNFVTVQVDGDRNEIVFDRHRPECLTRKSARSTAWMFHGVIYGGKKAFRTFWEWGSMNSEKYDEHILAKVEEFIGVEQRMGKSPWYQHDNAPCHKSRLTQSNLHRRRIPTIEWPPYSPDLNLIEHVWVSMKRHIQDNYLRRSYLDQTISRHDLRELIQEAWDLIRDEDIAKLYDSWWDRCDAVIRANGGPTKY
uniref:Uncharacterized protein AlNc14C2136G13162 n=1 Tax=Albugo laibachii Nc14 TaxID=890382 RepID=F0X2W6_9STRA|nr:hypothetical protein ALNC14_144490 [Albugo laibachii Nc14]|eukprot:CCA28305.1 hypothetical protein ALNC14_144490 [Albugo laibachii Nc14]